MAADNNAPTPWLRIGAKSLGWRFCSSSLLLAITWISTGKFDAAAQITGVHALVTVAMLFPLYEWFWEHRGFWPHRHAGGSSAARNTAATSEA